MMASLLAQFRDRYPDSSLISDLINVHGDQFVVRATIKINGTALASGMAADVHLEVAEDRARQRALAVMGIMPTSSPTTSAQTPAPPSPEAAPSRPTPPSPAAEKTPQLSPQPAESVPKTVPDRPNPAATSPPATETAASEQPQLAKPPSPLSEASEPDQPTSTAASKDSTVAATQAPTPVDLSDVIAQTDVELRRLGWSVAQGREYLEKTYNKRSRHDLSDEELLEFLLYLESLPTPNAPESDSP